MNNDEPEPPVTRWLATSRVTWWLQALILGVLPWVIEAWLGSKSGWQ
jgi:hypothetical protein